MQLDRAKHFCPERVVEQFGSRSPTARAAVATIYESLDAMDEVDGSEDDAKLVALARRLRVAEKRPSPHRLRCALEAYYAAVVCLVVEKVFGSTEALGDVDELIGCDLRTSYKDVFANSNMATQAWPWHPGIFDQEPPPVVDWFGPLYQDLFPRSLRHALGEYYTPPWLAEHVLDTVDYLATPQNRAPTPKNRAPTVREWATSFQDCRLLDPTCGSGVFLLAAIRRIRAAAEQDVGGEELGRLIFEKVAGFDVNRLAVLTARANFLLAVVDLFFEGPPYPTPPVRLRDVILDPTEPGEPFDFVVGNPPWVAWDNLDEDYRERTKPMWQQYGLFSLGGTQARHGGGKKDLSMLVLYRSADRYLRSGGRLGFVITQTLFQTKGAGDGFRRFRLGEQGEPLGVLRVDDLSATRPFAGASNWTATVALEKGCETVYPVRYVRWREADGNDSAKSTAGLASSGTRNEINGGTLRFDCAECCAQPIDLARARSPWMILPKGLKRNLGELVGPSDYTANLGANSGGANGVYWVEVLGAMDREEHAHASVSMAPGTRGMVPSQQSDVVMVRNLADVGKRSVDRVEACIERELLYPLVRWGDLRRWRAVASDWLLLAQDVETRSGIDEIVMRRCWPAALAYLQRFRDLLERRAAYRRYQSAGPFWSMYNVGPYTIAPIKVVWRRMDRRINAAVVESVDDPFLGPRPVVVQETCVQVAVESADEAHYLAAVLNSATANFLVAAHSVSGGKGFGTPSMLDYLNVRRFDSTDARHCRLSELSRQAHKQAGEGCETIVAQEEIDQLAGELRGLSREEAAAVAGYLDP